MTVGTTPGAKMAELGERAGAVGGQTSLRARGTEGPTVSTVISVSTILSPTCQSNGKRLMLGPFQKMVANNSFILSVASGLYLVLVALFN